MHSYCACITHQVLKKTPNVITSRRTERERVKEKEKGWTFHKVMSADGTFQHTTNQRDTPNIQASILRACSRPTGYWGGSSTAL